MFYSGPLTSLKRKEGVILISRLFKFPHNGSNEMVFCAFSMLCDNYMALTKIYTLQANVQS